MSISGKLQTANLNPSQLVIQTTKQQWVIPNNVVIIKALLEDQAIKPDDLKFSCDSCCQAFIKKILLLALEDECKNHQPSPIAEFARALIHGYRH